MRVTPAGNTTVSDTETPVTTSTPSTYSSSELSLQDFSFATDRGRSFFRSVFSFHSSSLWCDFWIGQLKRQPQRGTSVSSSSFRYVWRSALWNRSCPLAPETAALLSHLAQCCVAFCVATPFTTIVGNGRFLLILLVGNEFFQRLLWRRNKKKNEEIPQGTWCLSPATMFHAYVEL